MTRRNMITIIHGDDIVSSRNYYQGEKKKEKNVIIFEGTKLTATDLAQSIHGGSLFGSESSIFIEDFLTKAKETIAKEVVDFIIKNHRMANIFFWESKEIQKRSLLKFKEATVKTFKLPKNIFSFLDNLRPNNFRYSISLFHKTLNEAVNEELIFFMLQRQFRLLLALRSKVPLRGTLESNQIDEITRLAPWQKGKLVRQARLFSKDQLLKVYNKLYNIEIGLKTGTLNMSLPQAIDFLLLEM